MDIDISISDLRRKQIGSLKRKTYKAFFKLEVSYTHFIFINMKEAFFMIDL